MAVDAPSPAGCRRPVLRDGGAWLRDYGHLIDRTQPLAVAFSGGADSTALLLALAACHPAIEAWHIDHGWHPDAADQARQLADRCAGWGISFRSQQVVCSLTHNREADARTARLQAFAAMARRHGITQLALAHHADDQAETVLMRLLHGDGVRGCRGMPPVQQIAGLRLIRPLLTQPRAALRQALRQADIPWLDDPSNRDTALRRNHIRLRLLPAMNHALAARHQGDATGLLLRWQRQAVRIAAALDQASSAIAITPHPQAVSIPWQPWRDLPRPVRAWTLQRMAEALFGAGVCLGRRHIELIEAWRQRGGRHGVDLSRCRLERRQRRLWLRKAGQPR